MPEYISRPTRSIPWDGIVAIGNATKDQSWWQDPAGDDPTLLFSIDASVRDQDLDNVLARKLQQHAVETGIPLKAMHVDVTKLWIKDRTLELVSYYDYEPPWQSPGADARELFFPLEVYGSWLSHTTEDGRTTGAGSAKRCRRPRRWAAPSASWCSRWAPSHASSHRRARTSTT
ncbi:unnamed protein product [Prorocentrum cordatum]|uniref:Uncharacterized protein n=1 Tax=Prorocentrum cordatum TaxID=2364126 RepID=A0ABN9QN84_9DINO|nr:unnamed protein product [Polarella glacialis]